MCAPPYAQVTFHPGFLGDRQSGAHESPLHITYKEHPQKDRIKLAGELCFPNLIFDIAKVWARTPAPTPAPTPSQAQRVAPG